MNAVTEQWLMVAAIAVALMVLARCLWVLWPRPTRQVADGDTERMPKYAEPQQKLLVVAGTYRQFEQYCARTGLNRFHDALYVDSALKVDAYRKQRFVLVGTWEERPDLEEVRAALAYAGCILL